MQIAKILKEDKVLTAKAHYAKKKGKALPENPYNWKDSTIVGILERMDYCGHTVNFKSYSKSHKLKKRIPTTKEQQAIFYNTHEAIVEDAVFERVQELRANKRRPTKAERQGSFSGLVYCADVGVNYISPLAEVLTVHKTITAVQNTRAIQEAVRLILSARKC